MAVAVDRQEIRELLKIMTPGADPVEFVRGKLLAKYPALANETIRRNGYTVSRLDYILSDIESYG